MNIETEVWLTCVRLEVIVLKFIYWNIIDQINLELFDIIETHLWSAHGSDAVISESATSVADGMVVQLFKNRAHDFRKYLQ